jgi:hypothetical protein
MLQQQLRKACKHYLLPIFSKGEDQCSKLKCNPQLSHQGLKASCLQS